MCQKEAELFKVLSVESRIRIIDLLKQRGPLGVNEMAQTLGITPSAVSQHLRILRHAGLVRNQRKGFWIPYEVDQTALEQCGEVISNVCRCGCEESCRVVDQTGGEEINPGEEELADLKRREQELEQELQEVRTRMEKVREDI
jgi:ArsR family transcriptional regulator, arsenate/arsenite/antimonite-responsive transcriptional repressor